MRIGSDRHVPGPARVVVAFGGFILIGIAAGVSGVLLPAQMADYHVTRSTIGLMFVTFSAGYLLSGAANGWLVGRFGARAALATGTGMFVLSAAGAGLRPGFVALLAVNLVLGFGTGVIDAGLNAYLAASARGTALLNYLHAFFGVGALIGPVLAARMLTAGARWNDVYLVLAAVAVPLLACFLALYPGAVPLSGERHPLLRRAVRHPAVWLVGLFLCLYVGVEASVGNWGFSYLTGSRGQSELRAGWALSGYWLGLTAGRFTLNAVAERLGLDASGLTFACLAGMLASTCLAWLAPPAVASITGLVLLGYFLGPLFPTAVAVLPGLVHRRLVATAVGLVVGSSVIGGAALPWLAGALTEYAGLGLLLPYCLALSVLLVGAWWRISRRLAPAGTGPAGRGATGVPGAGPVPPGQPGTQHPGSSGVRARP